MDDLGAHGRLGHHGRLAQARGAVHLLVGDGVGDVAHDGLADGHGLGVDGQLRAQVGHVVDGGWVHSDVADGLSSSGELHGAGCGRCNVSNVLGLWTLNDVVDSLDDRGVGGGRVGDNSRLHGRGRHDVSLCRDHGLRRDQGLCLQGGLGVGLLLDGHVWGQDRGQGGSSVGGDGFQQLWVLALGEFW